MVIPLTICCRMRAITLRAGSREPEVGHGAPVGHGDRVELEMQLLAEVERHLLRPLRLDHAPVLPEDHVLELLEHALGLVEVVVLPDEAVAAAAIGGDRLGDKQIEEAFRAAPVHVYYDRVGQTELVARATHRALALLV